MGKVARKWPKYFSAHFPGEAFSPDFGPKARTQSVAGQRDLNARPKPFVAPSDSKKMTTWWTFRIFFNFFLIGGGEGGVRGGRRGGICFLSKISGEGVLQERGGGAPVTGRASVWKFGGGEGVGA